MATLLPPQNLNLTEDDFWKFAELVHRKAGINLHQGKKELVRYRLAKAVREGGFKTFGEYYQFVIEDQSGDELVRVLDSISTNLTSFFRENAHFEFLAQVALPEWIRKHPLKKQSPFVRMWSAGCSTGEEAYSIAMTVLAHFPELAAGDFKILATDISTRVLETARRGIYPEDRVRGIPEGFLRRFFQKGRGQWEGHFQIREDVKKLVAFRRLNLMEPFPLTRPLFTVFCRNVMIYFDKKTQEDVVGRIYQSLMPGGYLMIGHSEGLSRIEHRFGYIQPTVYRK